MNGNTANREAAADASARVSTGISGLDEVLQGGLIPGRAYLVRGGPGSGKTTLGLHFLTADGRDGTSALFISLGETEGPPQDQLLVRERGVQLVSAR